MKVNIGICDDNREDSENLSSELYKLLHTDSTSINIFESKDSLLESIVNDKKRIDILFLDVEIGEENGIELGRLVKKEYRFIKIVFVSSFPKYVFDSFEAFPISYLLKPINPTQLKTVLFYLIDEFENQQTDLISFKEYHSKREMWLSSSKIILVKVESSKEKKLKLHTSEGEYTILGRMKPFFDSLDKSSFCQIYRDTIINIDHISKVYSGRVYLSNGMLIAISRRYLTSFKEHYHKYKIKEIWK
ncbi:LytTR family DNA-binding domain-containing protein [Enterococcus sp.]|uniref:LytR/AlgR family response regulator transcription factor n=1 Tax=Enterococcus sp. TaxID=35783 RepID=UPI00290F1EA5|nr:LytTR family DNA-binding domain-containing protein [Enterococcus sp.]MDU5337106.1 LytTR family DNA-binding domain-containing protein [Enterococcus sp.]